MNIVFAFYTLDSSSVSGNCLLHCDSPVMLVNFDSMDDDDLDTIPQTSINIMKEWLSIFAKFYLIEIS